MSLFNLLPDSLNLKEKIKPFLKDKLPIAPSEYDIVAQISGMKLLHFKPSTSPLKPSFRTPLFIIPSMINRYYVLDLLPGKSIIEYFVSHGVDVYLLDWGQPFDEDNWLSFEELITHRLDFFVDLVIKDSGSANVNILGHCLGGTLATIYSILNPQKTNGLLLFTTPIDFEHGGKLGFWVNQNQFSPENITKAYGHMPWWVLQSSFQMLKPMLPWHKIEKVFKEFKNPEFMKNFWALEIWSQDNVSFPGRCFTTIIEELYKKNSLAKGQLRIAGETITLGQLKSPVLNLAAVDDHIVLFKSTLQNYHLEKDSTLDSISADGGHIGSLLGSRAQKTIWPQILEWFSKVDQLKH